MAGTSRAGPEEAGNWLRRTGGKPIRILGHRGGRGPWRENTLEAFAGALREGADGVELDVRRTSDGRLVVHHDPGIEGTGMIHELAAKELPTWVPRLEEALAVCPGSIVNVEIKNSPIEAGFDPPETVAAEVLSVLSAGAGPGGKGPAHVVVSSFWPANLAALRTLDPGVATGLLVHPSFDPSQASDQAAELGCLALHPFHSQISKSLVEEVHGKGMALAVWTVNEPEDLAAMASAGVDMVITDSVGEARSALGLVRGGHPRGQSGP